jgi:folate-binding protein YgfZ
VSNEFESLPGAVGSPPQHYGNPLAEQKALAAGSAVVDLSNRSILTITGPDRLTWLDSLTSQSIAGLKPGESSETLQLDPTGHLEYAIRLVDDGETAWLLVDEGEGEPLLAWLGRMRFMLRVELADVSDRYATIGTLGTPPLNAVVTWVDPWRSVVSGGHQYALTADHPGAAFSYSELVIERERLVDAAALPAAGTLALEALRVAAWRPRFATEVDEKSIPHELDWLRSAVHLTKGCYRGQETVAKVHNLGHPPRRLVMLHLDGSEGVLPAPGSSIEVDDKSVGQITSSALHYELGPVALAVIKRSVDPAASLTVVSDELRIAAAQEVIVPTDAGAVADVPRLPRLGAVARSH